MTDIDKNYYYITHVVVSGFIGKRNYQPCLNLHWSILNGTKWNMTVYYISSRIVRWDTILFLHSFDVLVYYPCNQVGCSFYVIAVCRSFWQLLPLRFPDIFSLWLILANLFLNQASGMYYWCPTVKVYFYV